MKVVRAVLVLFALTSFWMAYDNVLTDDAPIRALAEQAACTVKHCANAHGMTKLSRTPLGQSIEYSWQDGPVEVSCHRAYFVAGERTCAVAP